MEAKLVVVGGEAKSGEVKIKKLPSVVGRGDEADIRLRHPLVSRKHCEIFEQNGYLKVRDLGSLNGTFIANTKVKEATLKPDELITIGPVVFRAVYEGPAKAEDEGDDLDFDLGDDFEINETQPLDIKKTTAANRETVMLDELDEISLDDEFADEFAVEEEPQAKKQPKKEVKPEPKKAEKKDAAAEEDFGDLDDLDFEISLDDNEPADANGAEASPAQAAAADAALDDDAFADLLEEETESPGKTNGGAQSAADDDEFADLLEFDLADEAPSAKEEPPKQGAARKEDPAKKAAAKKDVGKKDSDKDKSASAKTPAKETAAADDDFNFDDLDNLGGGEDEELDDFLKDLGLEK